MPTPLQRYSRFQPCCGSLSLALALTLALAAFQPGAALAQTAMDSATAEVLFNEALALLANQKPKEACLKLEESQRLDPGVGTLLYLADCYREVGRTASAWATFKEAAYMAKSHGDEREAVALEQARELEAKLSYLTLEVSAARGATELQLLHDGKVVGQALWNTAFPVDPGAHVLEATAPGKKSWSVTLNVAEGPHQERVAVPVLEAAAPEPALVTVPPPTSAESEGDAGRTQKTVGWVLLGVGSAAVVTGGVFALLARSDDSDAAAECRPDRASLCNAAGVELGESAQTKATLAGVSAGVGLAALGAGVTLLLTAPKGSNPTSSELALHASPLVGGGAMAFSATW